MTERLVISDDPVQKAFFDKIQSLRPTDKTLAKAIDFTILEDDCLAEWLEAVLQGRFEIARRLLREGLMAEHYRSLLADVLDENDEATVDQQRVLNNLRDRFRRVREKFRGRNPVQDNPVERPERPRPREL